MSAKVKICGITRLEDARLAVESGAWAIGMIFHPESPRHVEQERAAEIATALRRRCEVVGVFVNAPLDDVLRTSAARRSRCSSCTATRALPTARRPHAAAG